PLTEHDVPLRMFGELAFVDVFLVPCHGQMAAHFVAGTSGAVHVRRKMAIGLLAEAIADQRRDAAGGAIKLVPQLRVCRKAGRSRMAEIAAAAVSDCSWTPTPPGFSRFLKASRAAEQESCRARGVWTDDQRPFTNDYGIVSIAAMVSIPSQMF